MPKPQKARSVIGTFFKESNGRLFLDGLIVISTDSTSKGREFYAVDYSRTYGYIFHMSGAGGDPDVPDDVSGIYFVSGDAGVNEVPSTLVQPEALARNETRRLRTLPPSFKLQPGEDLLDWLERNGIDDESVWCATCRDCFPGDTLCEHTWWCDRTAWYSTPSEYCGCANREQCRNDDAEAIAEDAEKAIINTSEKANAV